MSPPRTRLAPASRHQPRAHPGRWHSLDVLKGLALWAMIAHHFQEWTGGEIHGRFLGFERFALTDLAPPLFAMALGAGAAVVGGRVTHAKAMASAVRRWAEIFAIGVVLDLATHQGNLAGRGVLPTLAILGLLVTAAVASGVRQPWVWWAVAAACAFVAVPALSLEGDDPVQLLINGPFALPVYGIFAAAGAAVATSALGHSERRLPLFRAAAGVLVVGLGLAALGGGAVAPDGVWPPARYPGHLPFTLWALLASLVLWGAARALLGPNRALGVGVARAGRRTLAVFAGHFLVQIALRQAGVLGDLDTHAWGMVAWVATIALCAATTIPLRTADRR